jgi:hypothetical protein
MGQKRPLLQKANMARIPTEPALFRKLGFDSLTDVNATTVDNPLFDNSVSRESRNAFQRIASGKTYAVS